MAENQKQQNVTLSESEKRDQKERSSLDEYFSKTIPDGSEEISSDHPGPALQSFVSDEPISDPAGSTSKQVSSCRKSDLNKICCKKKNDF